MTALPWGRLYYEWAHDLKIQTLPEAFQRRHAMLLCMHIEGLTHPADEDAAFYMRVSLAEWLEAKAAFMAKGLLDETNHLINWERRQYKSDNSTARSQKSRATAMQRCSNVAATPPDTETDTEAESETEPEEKNSPPTPPPGGEVADDGEPGSDESMSLSGTEAVHQPEAVAPSRLAPDQNQAVIPADVPATQEKTISPPNLPAVAEDVAWLKVPAVHQKALAPAGLAAQTGEPSGSVRPGKNPAYALVAEAYHRLLPHLPPHQVWSDRDVRHFQRNRQLDPVRGSPEFWSDNIFPQVAQSPFLSGRCPPKRGMPWRASLPWLLNPDNVAKILNGHYAGDSNAAGYAGGSGGSSSAKRSISTFTGGKSSAANTRLPAPQEFGHEIKPIGHKNHAAQRGENLLPARGLHRPEPGGG